MIKMRMLTLLIVSVLALPALATTGPKIDEGLWEITTEIETTSVPDMNSLQKTQRQCITNKNLVPNLAQKQGQACKTLDTVVSGDTVSWTMECSNDGNVTKGKGKITYEKDKMHGTTSISVSSPFEDGGQIEMTTRIKGHRIGDC